MDRYKNLGVLILFLFIFLMMISNVPSFWGGVLELRLLYTVLLFGFVVSAFYIVLGRRW